MHTMIALRMPLPTLTVVNNEQNILIYVRPLHMCHDCVFLSKQFKMHFPLVACNATNSPVSYFVFVFLWGITDNWNASINFRSLIMSARTWNRVVLYIDDDVRRSCCVRNAHATHFEMSRQQRHAYMRDTTHIGTAAPQQRDSGCTFIMIVHRHNDDCY